jgi:hypothetical protein
VAGLLVIAAATMRLAFRRRPAAAEPVIEASFKELRQGWYQVDMTVTNRAPYGLVGVSLRRVRPGAARLMAPIKSASTPQGDFQVWSDPAVDKPATTIDSWTARSAAWRGVTQIGDPHDRLAVPAGEKRSRARDARVRAAG